MKFLQSAARWGRWRLALARGCLVPSAAQYIVNTGNGRWFRWTARSTSVTLHVDKGLILTHHHTMSLRVSIPVFVVS